MKDCQKARNELETAVSTTAIGVRGSKCEKCERHGKALCVKGIFREFSKGGVYN